MPSRVRLRGAQRTHRETPEPLCVACFERLQNWKWLGIPGCGGWVRLAASFFCFLARFEGAFVKIGLTRLPRQSKDHSRLRSLDHMPLTLALSAILFQGIKTAPVSSTLQLA